MYAPSACLSTKDTSPMAKKDRQNHSTWTCTPCEEDFSNYASYEYHIQTKHEIKIVPKQRDGNGNGK